MFFCVMGLFFIFFTSNNTTKNPHHTTETTIHVNKRVQLKTQIADEPKERSIGLSHHTFLNPDEAMLFIFEKTGLYGFHMPDMDFSIDIFWLDENKKVVFMKEYARPEDFPEVYTPTVPALYVVETVAGFASDHSISIGYQFNWE